MGIGLIFDFIFIRFLIRNPASERLFSSFRMALVDSPNSSANPRRWLWLFSLIKNFINKRSLVLEVISESNIKIVLQTEQQKYSTQIQKQNKIYDFWI